MQNHEAIIAQPHSRRVCVAVPTFRRPAQLAALLAQLALQEIDPSKYRLRFLVVDNDDLPTARATVDEAQASFRQPLSYVHVPDPGLSAVRNAALCNAGGEDDYLAMIDDDEVPEPAWLAELLRVAALTNSAAVVGNVWRALPPGAPRWVARGRFFGWALPLSDECVELGYGISGNCLLALSAIRALRLAFDTDFNLSGGEDTSFFRQLLANGGSIVYSPHAVVTEIVPLARTRLRYLVARAFRDGNTLSLCDLRINPSARSTCMRLFEGFRLIGAGLCFLPCRVARLGGAGAAQSLCDAARGLGMLAGLAGYRYLEYRRAPDPAANPSRGPADRRPRVA